MGYILTSIGIMDRKMETAMSRLAKRALKRLTESSRTSKHITNR